jgi:hypothetical protein
VVNLRTGSFNPGKSPGYTLDRRLGYPHYQSGPHGEKINLAPSGTWKYFLLLSKVVPYKPSNPKEITIEIFFSAHIGQIT